VHLLFPVWRTVDHPFERDETFYQKNIFWQKGLSKKGVGLDVPGYRQEIASKLAFLPA
jgi:hypothetical protein